MFYCIIFKKDNKHMTPVLRYFFNTNTKKKDIHNIACATIFMLRKLEKNHFNLFIPFYIIYYKNIFVQFYLCQKL